MAKREKFSQRIYNACRALRGEPWPQVFEFANPPMMKAERPDIQTIAAQINFDRYDAKIMDPDDLLEYATKRVCVNLARELEGSNAVEIYREETPGGVRYTGRLQVVMPEKKEG